MTEPRNPEDRPIGGLIFMAAFAAVIAVCFAEPELNRPAVIFGFLAISLVVVCIVKYLGGPIE